MFSNFIGKGSHPPSGGQPEDDASLDKVLPTPGAKLEFILLVMLSTDRMRADIDAIFDPSITTSPAPTPAPSSPWEDGRDSTPSAPPSYRQATREPNLGRDDYIRRKRELGSVQMREMQGDTVRAFANWRVRVLKRVGEVLKVRADVVKAEKARRDAGGLGTNAGPYFGGQVQVQVEAQDRAQAKVQSGGDLISFDDEPAQSATTQSSERRHPQIPTLLVELDEDKRKLLLNSLLLLLLSLEHYSAYSRVLLLFVASSLNLTSSLVTEQEDTVAHGLLKGAKAQMDAEASRKRENNKSSADRAWKVGLATVAGAAVIGLTGGLAAPFLAGAVGTVLGGIGLGGTAIAGLLGTLAGNFVVIGTLFGAYGGSMTGKMMDKYAKEVEDFSFIPLRRVDEDKHRLRVTIGISGWLSTKEERYLPWLVLGDRIESFALQWELEVLLQLGGSLTQTFKELAVRVAAVEIIKRTVFAGLLVALWPLGLLRLGKMLSNSFSVAQARADKAGQVLADALIHKAQGERPVILIGYSLGARTIYSCLQTLAKRKAFGLVESVILMGLPASAESHNWRAIRAVVADRVVNVYSRNDYILGLVYRTSSITPDVAGLQPIDEVAGIENVDVSDLVSGHMRYRFLVGAILDRIGYETIDREQLENEKRSLDKLDAQEEQMKKEQRAKEAGKKQDGKSEGFGWNDMLDNNHDARELNDKEIEERLKAMKIEEEREGQKRSDLEASHFSTTAGIEMSQRSQTSSPAIRKSPFQSLPSQAPPLPARTSNVDLLGDFEAPPPELPTRPSAATPMAISEPEPASSRIDKTTTALRGTEAKHDDEHEDLPWKRERKDSISHEPLQMLQPDAVVTDDEDDFPGHHRIAMVDDK